MKSGIHYFFALLVLLSSVSGFAQTAPAAVPSAAHLAAAERVVYAMGLPERFIIPTKQLLQRSLEKDPANAGLMSAVMNPYLEKRYTANQLRNFFASRFDTATCLAIAKFWEGPVGKKMVRNQVQTLDTGEPQSLEFTAKEKAIIKRFENTEASRQFVVAIPDIEETFAEYTKNTQMKMRESFLLELEKQSAVGKT